MDWLMVVPAIDPTLTAQCIGAMSGIDRDRVIVVDNAPNPITHARVGQRVHDGTNRGVAASWNIGARRVVQERRDILIICSTSVVFGAPGGADLVDQLGRTDGYGLEIAGAGWHLVAVTRATLELTGPFDEGFWPAYWEDTSYLVSMARVGLPSPRENGRAWPQVVVDYQDAGYALSIHNGHVTPEFGRLAGRYRDKWGGDQGSETYLTPWDLPVPVWWWPGTPYDMTDPWGIGSDRLPSRI